MPQLGESVVEGTVTRWLKKEGDTIGELDPLLEVNTDKVDTEIPSPAAGTVVKILVPEGTTVTAGTILAWIGEPGEAPNGGDGSPAAQSSAAETGAKEQEKAAGQSPAGDFLGGHTPGRDKELGFISPVVAKLAREHDVDLARVKGTVNAGRITKKDVLAFLEERSQTQPEASPPPVTETAAWETPGEGDLFRPTEMLFTRPQTDAALKTAPPPEVPAPAAAPSPTPPSEQSVPSQGVAIPVSRGQLVPHSPVRKAIAQHMVESKRTSPHVTTVMEADMTRVARHREGQKAAFARDGVRLTYTAYFLAAAVAALQAYPLVNSSWSEDGIRIHSGIHVGVAVSLGEHGLIVPVIRGADGLSLLGLARAVNDLADRARSRQLKPDEVKGGTFTISNHGTSGSLLATPIINQPQVAILGVGAVQKRVVVIDDAIAIRPMVYLTLTFDHRVLDGYTADQYLEKVVTALENWV